MAFTTKVLLIGGGGSGARGGGGGGGYQYDAAHVVVPGAYNVVVGTGGSNANGLDSVFDGITAIGGGFGGNGINVNGNNGGCGGGAGAFTGAPTGGTGSQGGNGGSSSAGNGNAGCGGGGTSQNGVAGVNNLGGNGGNGTANSISGSSVIYGGGGGGACSVTNGMGGTGGGGNASVGGDDGTNGLGGGGGGGTGGGGGVGGSGVVIFSYLTSLPYLVTNTNGVVTTDGANTVITFLVSGTLTITALSSPAVTTQQPTFVSSSAVTAKGTITDIGHDASNNIRGFVYDTVPHALPGNVAPGSSGYASNVSDTGSYGLGAYTKGLSGLSASTTYYVRAFTHNGFGYAYGNEITFNLSLPVVTTQEVDFIGNTVVRSRGGVDTHGADSYDIRGFVYDTVSHALPGNVAPGASGYATNVSESGTFALPDFFRDLSTLTPGTRYYIRAFGHDVLGYSYGAELNFNSTFTDAYSDLPASLSVSAYKWLTKKLYDTQKLFTTTPHFTAKIIDDTLGPTGTTFAGVNPNHFGSAASAPDDNIVAAGFGSDNKVHFMKGRNLASGLWDRDIILDSHSDIIAPGSIINQVAIAVSDFYLGGYHIDIAYLSNFDGSAGASLILKLWRSDDSGASWTLQTFVLSDLPYADTSNHYVALMHPRYINGVMTSGFIYLSPSGDTMESGYPAYNLRYSQYPNASLTTWDGKINSKDWTIHSFDSYYYKGVDYIIFSGFRNIVDIPNDLSINQTPNYSLWLTALQKRSFDYGSGVASQVWLPPVSLLPASSASATNQNQYIFPRALVQNGQVDVVFQSLTVNAIAPSAQGSLSATTTVRENYMYMFSQDGKNFTYPQILLDSSNDFIVSPSSQNGLQSFAKQDMYLYICGGNQIYQFVYNNIVADITEDLIGYGIQESAGQPSNVSLQIANQNNGWYGDSPSKPGALAIKGNSKIAIWQGYYNSDGVAEDVPKNVYYIDDIKQLISGNQNDLSIVGRDWFKKLLTLITRVAFQLVGPLFYTDVFDGSSLGNWNQIQGSWFEQNNQLIPRVNSFLDTLQTSSVIVLNGVSRLTHGSVMTVVITASEVSTSNSGAGIYAYYIDETHWLRLTIRPGTIASNILLGVDFYAGDIYGNLGSQLVPINWTENNIGFFIRQYDYYKFNFMITDTPAAFVGNSLTVWNNAKFLTLGGTGEIDMSSYFTSKDGFRNGWSVGLGSVKGDVMPFSFFRYAQFGPVNNIFSVAQFLSAKAGVLKYVIQQLFNELLMIPLFNGTFQILNRRLILPPSGVAINVDPNKIIANGELIFRAKVTPTQVGTGKQFGLMCIFRNTNLSGDPSSTVYNSYRFKVWQYVDSNGYAACRFERTLGGTSTIGLFPNSQADDEGGGVPTLGSLNIDLTQYHDYRITMVDGWMYAFIDETMVAAWNDNNTDFDFLSTGSWGFQAFDNNSTVTIENIFSPNFWKPVQAFSLNAGDDIESAIISLVQSIRGWIFSDLFGRMKFTLLSSDDPSTYEYNLQLWSQNVDDSDKEYVNQVTVYGSGVMATAVNKQLMTGVPVREAVIVDYTITTQSDAQTKANQELLNFNQYVNQYSVTQVLNPGAELFDAITVVNKGNNTSGVDGPTRVYAQSFAEGGGNNRSDYSIQIQTGNL